LKRFKRIFIYRCQAQVKIGEERNAMIENPMLSTAEIINRRTVGMLSMNPNLHTPTAKDLKRSLYRYRRSVYQFPEPKFLADLKISDLVSNTIGGEKFLRFDSEDHGYHRRHSS